MFLTMLFFIFFEEAIVMKTPHQKKFEKLVTSIILCEPLLNSRTGVLEDFKMESEHYYEVFCDKVFEIALLKNQGILMIDERGLTYSDKHPNTSHHIYFQILTDEDLRTEADDVIVYIDLALRHLEEHLSKIQKSFA